MPKSKKTMGFDRKLGNLVAEQIKIALAEQSIKLRHFAKAIDSNESNVHRWINKGHLPPHIYWKAIERELQSPVFDVVREATSGYKNL